MWLDRNAGWSVEGDYLMLDQKRAEFDSGSRNSLPILARPFYNLMPRDASGVPTGGAPAEDSELVSYPNVLSGQITVDAHDYFQSAGIWGRYNLFCADPCSGDNECAPLFRKFDLLVGYRHFSLSDSVHVHENLLGLAGSGAPGVDIQVDDMFRASNDFHGAELGLVTRFGRGEQLTLDVTTKVAMGANQQVAVIDGSTVFTPGGSYTGGAYAVRSNIGRYNRSDFVMIPQLSLELGYQWNERFRCFGGYNLLYWGNVTRSADQIDRNIDTGNFPPVVNPSLPYPAFPGQQNSFWAQGLNFGAELLF
jgi:hypothetical protein